MLKGKAELILRDSKSGEVVKRVESGNMVTNAVNNVLSGALDKFASCYSNGLSRRLPSLACIYSTPRSIVEDLFGGILLFTKEITESPDHCIPSADERKSLVGYASSLVDSGYTSVMKGTYNADESEISGGKAKFVFDFNTSQANGVIKSICLTSALGGRYSFKNDFKAGELNVVGFGFPYNSSMFGTGYTQSLAANYKSISLLSLTDEADALYMDSDYVYAYLSSAEKIRKISLKSVNQKGVSIFSKFNTGSGSSIEYSDFDLTVETNSRIVMSSDLSCLWFVKYTSSSNTLKVTKVTGDAVKEEKTIDVTKLSASLKEYFPKASNPVSNIFGSSGRHIIVNDKLYFITGMVNNADQETYPTKARVYELDFSGNISYNEISKSKLELLFGSVSLGSASYPTTLETEYLSILGDIYIESTRNEADYFPVIRFDTTTKDIDEYISFFNKNDSLNLYGSVYKTIETLKEPWVVSSGTGASKMYSILLFMGYLATINNLTEGVEKTPDKTLKIIYTLSEE